MRLLLAKALCLLGLCVLLLAGALLPVRLAERQHDKGQQRPRRLLQLCNSFSGGVFLATCFNALLPAVRGKLDEVLRHNNVTTEYPVAETIMMVGFFLSVFVDQLFLTLQKDKPSFIDLETFNAGSDAGSDSENESPFMGTARGRAPFSEPGAHLKLPELARCGPRRLLGLLFALCTHSIFEGLALGLQEDGGRLLSLFLSVAVHETLVAVALGVSMAKAALPLRDAAKLAAAVCATVPLGIGLGTGIESSSSAAGSVASLLLQGIAGGTFLFITFFEILLKELEDKSQRLLKVLCLVLGYAALAGLVLIPWAGSGVRGPGRGGRGGRGWRRGGIGSAAAAPHRAEPSRAEPSRPRRSERAAPGGAEPPRRGRPGPGHALRPPRRPQPRADPGQDTRRRLRGQDAGAEQRLPRGRVRSRRRGQELAGAALRQGDLPRHVHPHHRGHVPAGDQLRQERVHAADHRHHGQPPVPGHAAPLHLQGPCLHPGLLGHQQAVAGGAEADLPADRADQGQRGEHPHHAGGQQVRRDAARGGEQGGGGRGQGVEMRLHGDLGQDELQRQGALPGAAEPGEEEERQPHHRREALQQAEEDRQNQGQVQHHVEPRTGPRPLPTPDVPSLLPPRAGRGSGIAAGASLVLRVPSL